MQHRGFEVIWFDLFLGAGELGTACGLASNSRTRAWHKPARNNKLLDTIRSMDALNIQSTSWKH